MRSAIETIQDKINQLWSEIATSDKDEFSTENQLMLAKIQEHERAIKELERL